MADELAGRLFARVYRVSGRRDLHAFLLEAVERSGGRVLYSSSPTRCPVYLGIDTGDGERVGVLCYPFRCNHPILGRAADEHRVQVRYGSEESWTEEHPLAFDVAAVDVTVVLGVHPTADLLVGLDPLLYDPLPMGISVEFKTAHVREATAKTWFVWERGNLPGRRRDPRSELRTEALVAFTPERFLDYVRFEREASTLLLDPPLRYRAALAARRHSRRPGATRHVLERQFELASEEILDLIASRNRLGVAVRGAIAERHLERTLEDEPDVVSVEQLDADAKHDFDVELRDGRKIRIECKNASPTPYTNGDLRVDTAKTRTSKGNPASRYYKVDQFDVIAACLWSATGRWEFRFARTADLARHADYPDRLAFSQHIDATWASSLGAAV